MYSPKHTKTKLINESYPRKDITDYVRSFVLYMRKKEGRVLQARHFPEAAHMLQLMNIPENTTYKSMWDIGDEGYYWGKQRVDMVPSNLGRGFIFYFRCNGCQRRAKYLYEFSMLESPLCRVCCRLRYEQPTRKARDLSRLLRKPYFSSETKYKIIRRAGITKEDIPDVGAL